MPVLTSTQAAILPSFNAKVLSIEDAESVKADDAYKTKENSESSESRESNEAMSESKEHSEFSESNESKEAISESNEPNEAISESNESSEFSESKESGEFSESKEAMSESNESSELSESNDAIQSDKSNEAKESNEAMSESNESIKNAAPTTGFPSISTFSPSKPTESTSTSTAESSPSSSPSIQPQSSSTSSPVLDLDASSEDDSFSENAGFFTLYKDRKRSKSRSRIPTLCGSSKYPCLVVITLSAELPPDSNVRFLFVLSILESHSVETQQHNSSLIVLSEARSGSDPHVLQTPLYHQLVPFPRHRRRKQLSPQSLRPPHPPQSPALRAEFLHFEVLRVHQQRRSHFSRRFRSPPNHRAAHEKRKAPRCSREQRPLISSIASREGYTMCRWTTWCCRTIRWST